MKTICRAFGFMLVIAALASVARANDPMAPEIDAGTAGSALTLLTGGLLILKDRVWRK